MIAEIGEIGEIAGIAEIAEIGVARLDGGLGLRDGDEDLAADAARSAPFPDWRSL